MGAIVDSLSALAFRDAVLLGPVALLLHVVEEWPGFPHWARRFASTAYSDREYVATHLLAVGSAVAAAVLLSRSAEPAIAFAVVALLLAPGLFWNACFHVGATCWCRTYCPGAVTGLLVYVPFSVWLAHLAIRDGVMGWRPLAVAAGVGLAAHVIEVGHNVFKRW
jgi:hypothetical protein